jgi:hypothetical protein
MGAEPEPEDPSPYACLGTIRGCGDTSSDTFFWGGGGGGGGGSGILDWNGDGWDDRDEFAWYAFGLQRWLEGGGKKGEWSKVAWGIVNNDPEVRSFMVREVYFGALRPLTLSMIIDEVLNGNFVNPLASYTNAAPGSSWYHTWQPALTIYINSTDLYDGAWTYNFARNTIAHEASRWGVCGYSREGFGFVRLQYLQPPARWVDGASLSSVQRLADSLAIER